MSASETGYSLLVSVYGLGMILASVMLLGVLRTSPSRTLLLGLLLMGLGTLLTAISPVFLATIGLQIMAGVGNGFQNIGNYTLLQLTVSKDIMGRVFGTTLSVAFAADSLASAVAGSLLETTSPRVVFLISGIGILFAALLIWWLLKREREIL